MRYILPPSALSSLNFLRTNYQQVRNVDLDKAPSMFGTPIFFGGTDVVARNAQTKFLKKIQTVLSTHLLKDEEVEAMLSQKIPLAVWEAKLESHLTASRVILAACLYVQSQISKPKKNSELYNLINKNLGITDENYFEDDDKLICFMAGNRVINSSLMALEESNTALRKAGQDPISEEEWNRFSIFLSESCKKDPSVNPYTNYPITSITQPMFGSAFSYTGATIGFLSGGMVSESTKVMSTKVQLTALIGSTLLMLGPAGPMGVALFSQVIACKLITSFCSISMAHVLGTVMGIIGQGIGMGIGLPLDAAYRLLWKACAVIGGYYTSSPNPSTGIRIKDGASIIGGIELKLTPESEAELSKSYDLKSIELKDGKLYLDGELVTVPDSGVQLPPEVLSQLKLQLKSKDEQAPETIDHPESSELTAVI